MNDIPEHDFSNTAGIKEWNRGYSPKPGMLWHGDEWQEGPEITKEPSPADLRSHHETLLRVRCRHLGNDAAWSLTHLTDDELITALQYATALRDLLATARNA
jgi:hypothetical protein